MLDVFTFYAPCDSSERAGRWPISNSQAGEISVFACPRLIRLPSRRSEVGMRSVHLPWQHPGVLSRLCQNHTHSFVVPQVLFMNIYVSQ
jgi:hypothetical protein